jgi:hypothetical protein
VPPPPATFLQKEFEELFEARNCQQKVLLLYVIDPFTQTICKVSADLSHIGLIHGLEYTKPEARVERQNKSE